MKNSPPIAFPFIQALAQNKLLMKFYLQEDGREMSEMLNEKKFTVREIGFSYRLINTWDANGLLDIERRGTDWRKFSVMDKVWLNIIRELRKYGISLKQILKVKQFLNWNDGLSNVEMPLLEIYTSIAAPRKIHLCIIVFEDASALICHYREWLAFLAAQIVPNHLTIHMGQIFANVFNNKNLIPVVENITGFSDEEINILQLIREGEYEQVKIKYKGKKAEILEGLKRFDVQTKITDILKEKEYQTIEVVKHAGQLRQITTWEKIKL